MVVGTIGMPGRLGFDGQSIKPKFFILGLPLFPTSCAYKVSQSLGIEIPITRKDAYHAYSKVHFGLIGLLGFVLSSNMRSSNGSMKIMLLAGSAILIGLSLYSWIKHSGPNEEQTIQRRIFGKAFQYNMPPEHLPHRVQVSLFKELQRTFIGKFKHANWQEDIKNKNVTKENFATLYTLAYYQKTLEDSSDHQYLFKEMEGYLNKTNVLKTSTETPSSQTAASTTGPTAGMKTDEKAGQSKTDENDRWAPKSTAPPVAMTQSKLYNQLTDKRNSESKTTNLEKSKSENQSQPQSAKGEVVKMSPKDTRKLHDAKDSLQKQLLLFAGLFLFGFIVAAVIMQDIGVMLWVLLITVGLWSIIAAAVFMGDYRKLNKDLANREKIKVKVRVKDLAKESDTAYFAFHHNEYGITKAQASAKFYSTGLLNKEIEMYVSKETHVLLEILNINY